MRTAIVGLLLVLCVCVGCSKPAPLPDPHEQLVADQTAKLREALGLLKGVGDEPTAVAAQPALSELRKQLSELFEREKQLGAWPKPDMKAVKSRNAAALGVVGQWVQLLPLRDKGEKIRAIADDWDGLLTQLKESLRGEAGK
jgi:hypothetical protein